MNRCGQLRVEGSKNAGAFFVSTSLAGELVGLREIQHRRWLVTFLETDLGVYDAVAKQFLAADDPKFREVN